MKRLLLASLLALLLVSPAHARNKMVNGQVVPYTQAEEAQADADELAKANTPAPLLEQLKAIFVSLPTETQADLGPLASAVYMFLDQGNIPAAKAVIERATIPLELVPVRDALLSKFP